MSDSRFRAALLLIAALLGNANIPSSAEPSRDCAAAGGVLASSSCADLRPGALIAASGLCTAGFLLLGSDRQRYMVTAGHCAMEGVGEKRWSGRSGPYTYLAPLRSLGPEKQLGVPPAGAALGITTGSDWRPVGQFVFAVHDDLADFALFRILPRIAASARVCSWGGPTGLYSGTKGADIVADPASMTRLMKMRIYGHGLVVSGVAPARTLVGYPPLDRAYAWAFGPTVNGDSGAPVILEDGRALGIHVAQSIPPYGGNSLIVRLGPAVARGEKALKIKLKLATASLN